MACVVAEKPGAHQVTLAPYPNDMETSPRPPVVQAYGYCQDFTRKVGLVGKQEHSDNLLNDSQLEAELDILQYDNPSHRMSVVTSVH
jgi:hypothetical protein